MVTRKDLADRLGVSVSVVSRALNNSGYVEAEKKERILQAAREMGYSREPAALKKAQRSSHCVTLFTLNTRNPFYVEFHLGVRDELFRRGYSMILFHLPGSGDMGWNMSDGIVFSNESLAFDYLMRSGRNDFRPTVAASFAGVRQLPRHITMVEYDLWKGAEKAIRYLRKHGHRRIAMVSPFPRDNPDSRIRYWSAEMFSVFGPRIDDYYLEVTDQDRAIFPEGNLISGGQGQPALTGEDFFENGVLAARRFRESGCDATAVICFNEEMGIGFCKAMKKLGVRIPEDLSVIGYDGTYLRRYMDQALTVLSLQPYLVGQMCADSVIRLIQGEKVRNRKLSLTEILEGETVTDLSSS